MNNKGFTLIELITVIMILSILAVAVAPKSSSTAGYEANAHRAQLLSALRLIQQRAMQQTDGNEDLCHEIVFDSVESRYGIPNREICTSTFPAGWKPDATGHIVDDEYQITFNVNGAGNPQTVGFDWLGKPNASSSCSGGCTINIVRPGEKTLTITIEPEGYIHVFDNLS